MFHKSIGITVLVLALLRLLWKLLTPQPEQPPAISERNHRLANLGHWGLYGLMFALPLTGWVINSAANIPFQWMNLVTIGNLPGVSASWQQAATQAHWYLFLLLALMVAGHAFMALYHHYVHRNPVLMRMLPVPTPRIFFAIFFATLMVAVVAFYQTAHHVQAVATTAIDKTVPQYSISAIRKPAQHSSMQWQPVADASKLMFVGAYDGAAFDGEFKAFNAQLFFDPKVPEAGFFDVSIDTASVTTYSDQWDSSLPDEDWFFVSQFPTATYQAVSFATRAEGYIAEGVLSLKGISHPVVLSFTWDVQDDNSVRLQGSAVVNRRVFGIGSGTWADDPTIAFDVQVTVDLLLVRAQ